MKAIDLIRLLIRNRILLILTPILMAAMVVFLTIHPTFTYTSETTLYTGMASGSGVDMQQSLNFFATNTAFDNLINIIKSRETQQEVAIRLLAQHLMIGQADPKYISQKSFDRLNSMVPGYIRKLVVRKGSRFEADEKSIVTDTVGTDSLSIHQKPIFLGTSMLPSSINRDDYELTVRRLKSCMVASDTNFVYKLLNYNDPHYSIDAISYVNAMRMDNSDLVRLRFESDDPGICQQTLSLFLDICISNYIEIKQGNSDAVVKYFEQELSKVIEKLRLSEDNLLQFNKQNNIINYEEQSKVAAGVHESLNTENNEMRIKLAGAAASIKGIEEKLKNQNKIIPKSNEIIQKRNQLSEINAKIVSAETMNSQNKVSNSELVRLRVESNKLKDDIRESVNNLYSYKNTTEGIPVQQLLTDWINNVVIYEETKAGIKVQGERIKDFEKEYASYAPAGANLKRLEREIMVNEQEYLEVLHGLNLAKLKVQDAQFTTGIKAVDAPYYPLTANPTKRKLVVMVAAFFGFLFILTIILAMEYFDNSLKNPEKAVKRIKRTNIGVFPKLFLKSKLQNFPSVTNRTLELALQNIGHFHKEKVVQAKTILIFSTLQKEGKTIIAGNLAQTLKKQGKSVLYLNYSMDSLCETMGISKAPNAKKARKNKRYPFFRRLLGYEDKRVDYKSPFLQSPQNYLEAGEYAPYTIDKAYYSATNYQDLLLETGNRLFSEPDYVLIEIPPVLLAPYPEQLMASADTVLLVCRANRVWSSADDGILKNIVKATGCDPEFLLNGVEIPVLETVLGELPKKRSKIRRFCKNLVSMQFFNKNEI